MKITVAMVMSLDGRTTKAQEGRAYMWASPEDQAVFDALKAAHDCIVMGAKTYQLHRDFIVPDSTKPRIVLSRTPERFAQDAQRPGLHVMAASPQECVQWCQARGLDAMLLVGGPETTAQFLEQQLVDELCITVEPCLFGAGLPLTAALQQTIGLQLLECTQLNAAGALLLRYQVTKKEHTDADTKI